MDVMLCRMLLRLIFSGDGCNAELHGSVSSSSHVESVIKRSQIAEQTVCHSLLIVMGDAWEILCSIGSILFKSWQRKEVEWRKNRDMNRDGERGSTLSVSHRQITCAQTNAKMERPVRTKCCVWRGAAERQVRRALIHCAVCLPAFLSASPTSSCTTTELPVYNMGGESSRSSSLRFPLTAMDHLYDTMLERNLRASSYIVSFSICLSLSDFKSIYLTLFKLCSLCRSARSISFTFSWHCEISFSPPPFILLVCSARKTLQEKHLSIKFMFTQTYRQ